MADARWLTVSRSRLVELRRRLLFLGRMLLILRLGSFIPVPGIDPRVVTDLLPRRESGIVGMLNLFSGGALVRCSVFALGILPHVSASVAIQILAAVHSGLAELRREGESGRLRLSRYTRHATLLLAGLQSVGLAVGLSRMPRVGAPLIDPRSFLLSAPLSLTCGTMFLTWLGEQITERGLGNGVSVIILVGILSGLPSALGDAAGQLRRGDLRPGGLSLLLGLIVATALLVVFAEGGQRRIVVSCAAGRRGRSSRGIRYTHLPLRINAAGVMPTIFASSSLLIVATAASWVEDITGWHLHPLLVAALRPGGSGHLLLHAAVGVLFCFLYTSLIFSPREVADNLRRSGLFVPGIRPGEQTARHVGRVAFRLTGAGAAYVSLVCLVPELVRRISPSLRFSGPSLLVVVVVIMDLIAQLQVLLLSDQYGAVLRKIGASRPGR